jgi:hypothetical protein
MKAIHTTGLTLLTFLITVSISFGQPVITNQPSPQATAPGATVTFQVGATSSEPLLISAETRAMVFPISRIAPMPPWSSPACSRGTHLTIAWSLRAALAREPALWPAFM